MKLNKYFKYFIRFTFLQVLISYITIWFFNNYLIINLEEKQKLVQSILNDRERFFPIFPKSLVTVESILIFIVFIFLILLYTSDFYTYVNELDFTFEKKYFDEYLNIYLLWTAFLFSFFYIFRFTGLSRSNLFLFSFIVPFVLLLFRNSELISTLLGRSVIRENYITYNLNYESIFRNLRIMAFRRNIGNFEVSNLEKILDNTEEINKSTNINLIVINLDKKFKLPKDLEEYLIKLNKKVLLISKKNIVFENKFIYRHEVINETNFIYFNNDIQYGSKFIVKRLIDIFFSLLILILLFPIMIGVYAYLVFSNGTPGFVRQKRVGLHGKVFTMYKFRTMNNNSHELRKELVEFNKKSGPLFKIDDDPRLVKGAKFLRKFSIDELPQLVNVILGSMSLVGPRPLFESDTKMFDKNYMRRLNVIPGMTGLLQINDRNTDDFDIWYKYDVEYIENWSILLDLKIMLKTIPSLFKRNIHGK